MGSGRQGVECDEVLRFWHDILREEFGSVFLALWDCAWASQRRASMGEGLFLEIPKTFADANYMNSEWRKNRCSRFDQRTTAILILVSLSFMPVTIIINIISETMKPASLVHYPKQKTTISKGYKSKTSKSVQSAVPKIPIL
jgi:hypothetical protein